MTWVKYQNCYNLRLEHSANWKYLGFYIRDLSIGKNIEFVFIVKVKVKISIFYVVQNLEIGKKSKFLFSAFGKKWILFLI